MTKKTILNIVIFLFVTGGIYLYTIYDNALTPPLSSATKTQEPLAPDFSYTPLFLTAQKMQSLSDHKGKAIFLHFWATWCPPCIVEFPDLIKLASNIPENFIILAVAKQDREEDINRFLAKLGRPLPDNFIITLDDHNHISKTLYDVDKLPETFLISTDFSILQKITGPQDNWSAPSWIQKIKRYISRNSAS
ncbi:MAG: TlpA family protein disulfide reductase [Alphaproteobacteria bacterium]|nr:TlpA family protein disulfide reductase [Alphaproteobacteria bacterium]